MKKIDDRRFNRLALIGLGAGFLLILIAFVAALRTFALNQESSERVAHTNDVIGNVSQVELMVERSETAVRGYLLLPHPLREKTYRDNVASIGPALDRIDRLTEDNPVQQAFAASLRASVKAELGNLDSIMRKATSGDLAGGRRHFETSVQQRQINAIRTISAAMKQQEELLLERRTTSERNSANQLKLVLSLVGLMIIAIGAFTFWLVRRYTASLTESRDRLFVLNTDLEGEVDRRTADLKRANEEIQRFAYIVSHDLRSPLVNILGFTAELEATNKALGGLIAKAEKTAPKLITDEIRYAQQDLPEAIGFIRAATQKMDRLINAILRLSREGRRTITPEQLPMDLVIDEIVATMAHRIEEENVTVLVDKPLPPIISDRVAIEQIFSNLIENAVKYLARGRPGLIRIRGHQTGSRAIFEVEDNGRGIDPKDHSRIFDLFRRSGAQDKPGEGIGLAQVRALSHRLGGWIDVQSEIGKGALFRLNLPTTYADEGANNE